MQSIDLAFKDHSVSLDMVQLRMKTLLGDNMVGMSADSDLTLHLLEAPSDEQKEAVEAYWNSLSVDSEEAKAYKSHAQIIKEAADSKAALKASASAKLAALGLSEQEISAIIGN